VFRRQDGYRTPVEDAPGARLLTDAPNPVIDSAEFWRTMIGWMCLRGNAYAYIERDNAGAPVGLWPIAPTSVEVNRNTQATEPSRRALLVYQTQVDGVDEYAPIREPNGLVHAENMLHFRGFGLGMTGLGPISIARQQIGTSFAASEYIGGFFARDAAPGGIISVDGNLTDDQYDRLTEQWKSLHEGVTNSHRLAVLEAGAKWETVTLSPADANFLEIMKYGRSEIASIFGVPPHMIGDLDRATFSNIEEQSIEYVVYGLAPWLVRLERVARRLFRDPDLYLRFNVNGLLRGDIAARYAAYAVGRQWGWLSANDVLRMEDEPPIPNGDDYLAPLNMVPAGSQPTVTRDASGRARLSAPAPAAFRQPAARAAATPAEQAPDWLHRMLAALRVFLDAKSNDFDDRDLDQWGQDLAELLRDPFAGTAAQFAAETAALFGGDFDPALIVNFISAASLRSARNVSATLIEQIDDAAANPDEGQTGAEAVAAVFAAAHLSAVDVAASMVNSMGAFGQHEGARQAGARTKTWNTGPHPRSSHASMNGETVGIDERFSNRCKWPQDPSGGVDEVAGCNCTVTFNEETS
jgi:HK97 family phage portal protein